MFKKTMYGFIAIVLGLVVETVLGPVITESVNLFMNLSLTTKTIVFLLLLNFMLIVLVFYQYYLINFRNL